eukprot:12241283-Heterocapsa_arctica.AAC.1
MADGVPGAGSEPLEGEERLSDHVLLEEEDLGVHNCPYEQLDGILRNETHLDRYNLLLRKSLDILLESSPAPFTIEEAYGLSPTSGVGPLALVHQNRLQPVHAAIIGTIY